VGLVWSGSTEHKNDHNRSLPLAELLHHLSDTFEYVSLQKEVRQSDQAALAASKLLHFGNELKDFTDTAALCECVDVVVSVDTSVAHLAGAMGKPTCVLLPYVPDWRWLLDREDSPWYASVKLYRQEEDRQWSAVLARVVADLPQHIQAEPKNLTALLQEAVALHQQGLLTQAKVLYEQILAQQPKHFDALHLLGIMAGQSGQSDLAVTLLSKAVAINPNDAAAYSNLGMALQALNRHEEAVANYDKAIAINPNHADFYCNRGNALLQLQRNADALASYNKAIAIKPDFADAHVNRGITIQELKREEEAVGSSSGV
jgi:tetratricopeptide (TPR) repeat protein